MKMKSLFLGLGLTLVSSASFADGVLFMKCFDAENKGGPALDFYGLSLPNEKNELNIAVVVSAADGTTLTLNGTGQRKGLKFHANLGQQGTMLSEDGTLVVGFNGKTVEEADGTKSYLGKTSIKGINYECHLPKPAKAPTPAPTTPATPAAPAPTTPATPAPTTPAPAEQAPVQPTQG